MFIQMGCSTFLFVQLSCSLLFDDNLTVHFAADFLKFNNKSFPLRLAVRGHDWGMVAAKVAEMVVGMAADKKKI